MGVSNVPAASAAGLQPKYQKFTSSGTFTLPTGYGAAKPLLVNISVIGGGGGGTVGTVSTTNGWIFSKLYYFGENGMAFKVIPANNTLNNWSGAGGSGGIASTQLYLTENLTITVGAQGTVASTPNADGQSYYITGNNTSNRSNNDISVNSAPTGNSGGTSIAGSIKASGGAGGNWNGFNQDANENNNISGTHASPTVVNNWNINTANSQTQGAGGKPAGTAGAATPLLGTMAGGSNDTNPVFGSFGIGGISTDGNTNTGVEGTGGGKASRGASGAVILTWWE